jgi:tRNA 2-thiouridine synthesizing protein A
MSSTLPFMIIAKTIDAKGLSCPLPLLKAKQGLHQIQAHECVEVFATDTGSVRDFHAFVDLTAHHMVEFSEHEDHYRYVIQKAPAVQS